MKKYIPLLLLVFTAPALHSQVVMDPLIADHEHWADSVLSTLSLDDKIGQLFMVAAYSNRDSNHVTFDS